LAKGELEAWDRWRAVRKLIQETPELGDLYRRLGYSPYVAERCRELLAQLNKVEVTIPDFRRFEASLDATLAVIQRHAVGEENLDPLFFADRDFFDAVVNARASQEHVLRLLNADARKELPFPIENAAIVRRPRSPDALAGALDDLDQLFPRLPQSESVREQLLEAVSEVRKELDRGGSSLVRALRSLEGHIEDSVFNIADDEQNEKKQNLDEVLSSLVWARHQWRPRDTSFAEEAVEAANTYLHSAWMHTKWLTTFILQQLLDGRAAVSVPTGLSQKGLLLSAVGIGLLLFFKLGRFAAIWFAVLLFYVGATLWRIHRAAPLVTCRREVASGNYDAREVARRLRDLERRGFFVHSVILGLLELDSA
jgi:hypothetical protein